MPTISEIQKEIDETDKTLAALSKDLKKNADEITKLQKKGEDTAKLSKAKVAINLKIAEIQVNQSELHDDLEMRSEKVNKQIAELSALISATEKNPSNEQTTAQLANWNQELRSYKKEKQDYVTLEKNKEATREKIYSTEKRKLYSVVHDFLGSQKDLEGLLLGMLPKEGAKKETGISTFSAVTRGIGFALSNFGTVVNAATSAGFLQAEIDKTSRVLSGEMALDPKNPPFFLRLLQDKDTVDFFRNHQPQLQNLLGKIIPSIVPVVLTELGKVDAINQELKAKKKELDALSEKQQKLEALKIQNKQTPSEATSKAIAVLEAEIEPLVKLKLRAQTANVIQALKKSGIGADYINEKILPIVLVPLKELLSTPEGTLELANLAIKLTQTTDEQEKAIILKDLLNKVDLTKILTASSLSTFLTQESTKIAEVVNTNLALDEDLQKLAKKYNITKELVDDVLPKVSKIAGSVLSSPEDMQKIFDLLKPVILDDSEQAIKIATTLKEIEKLDKESGAKKLSLVKALPDILLKESTLNLMLGEPNILGKHKEIIAKTLASELPTIFEDMRESAEKIASKCDPSLDRAEIVKIIAPPPALLLQNVTAEFYEQILPAGLSLVEAVLTNVSTEQVQTIKADLDIILNAPKEPTEAEKVKQTKALDSLITNAVSIMGSGKVGAVLSKDLAGIFKNELFLKELPTIVHNAVENVPNLKEQLAKFGISEALILSTLPLITKTASKALENSPELIKTYVHFTEFQKLGAKLASGNLSPEEIIAITAKQQEALSAMSSGVSKVFEDIKPLLSKDLPQLIQDNQEAITSMAVTMVKQEEVAKLLTPLGINTEFVEEIMPTAVNIVQSALPLVTDTVSKLVANSESIAAAYTNLGEFKTLGTKLESGKLSPDEIIAITAKRQQALSAASSGISKVFEDIKPLLSKDLPQLIQDNQAAITSMAVTLVKQEEMAKLLTPLGINAEFIEEITPTALNIIQSALPLVTDATSRLAANGGPVAAAYTNLGEFQKLSSNLISGKLSTQQEKETIQKQQKVLSEMLEHATTIIDKVVAPVIGEDLPQFIKDNKGNIAKLVDGVIKQEAVAKTLEELGVSSSLVKETTDTAIDLVVPMLPLVSKLASSAMKDKEGLQSIIMQAQNVMQAPKEEQEKLTLKLVGSILEFKNKNPEIGQLIDKEIPKLLAEHSEKLGSVVDQFLNQTKIGKNLRIKGEDVVKIVGSKMPQLTEAAELYTTKQYGKLIPKALGILFDKEVLKLVTTSALDVIKFKIQEKLLIDSDRRHRAGKDVDNILNNVSTTTDRSAENRQDLGALLKNKADALNSGTTKYSLTNKDMHGLHFKQEQKLDNFIIDGFNFTKTRFEKLSFENSKISNCSFKNVEFKEVVSFKDATIDVESLKTLIPTIEKHNKKHPEKRITLDGATIVGDLGKLSLDNVVDKGAKVIPKKTIELSSAIEQIKDALSKHTVKTSTSKETHPTKKPTISTTINR